jgi:hypothetical protein
MIMDINNLTKLELITEYEKCEIQWSKWSSDSLGYYMIYIHKRIVELGGFN